MKITLVSVTHGSYDVPDISHLPDAKVYFHELPELNNASSPMIIFSSLNDREADYFKNEKSFVERFSKELYKNYVNFPEDFKLIYRTMSKCEFSYPIGCSNNIVYEGGEYDDLENILRFNRSVKITNNILSKLSDYQKTIDYNRERLDDEFEKLLNFNALQKEYVYGKKTSFLVNQFCNIFESMGGYEDINVSDMREIFSEFFQLNNELYLNPNTLNSCFYKAKKEFKKINDDVVIFIGGPHGDFVYNFVSKYFSDIDIVSLEKNEIVKKYDVIGKNGRRELDNEITLAEKNNLIYDFF